ncbi:MAG: hypothetical protein H7Y32_09210 [Chloroflexales bacterium]|nr:hypothetical protein [Chloroflexales bacterium]
MKRHPSDNQLLNAIRPLELAAYLRAQQWRESERHDGRYALWLKRGAGAEIELLLPLNRALRDYTDRMADLLAALEIAEQRPSHAILADIQAVSDDVLHVGAEHDDFADGTMPLERAVRFAEHAYALLLAAACGTAQPREAYYDRKPPQALEYMQRVRMGPPARGSYVLTFHTPIPPDLRPPEQLRLARPDEPFERQVSQTLMYTIAAVRDAAAEATATGEFEPFLEAVSWGVSANLCDALVGMQEETGANQLGFRITWSPSRPLRRPVSGALTIASDAVPVIKEAARYLRELGLRDDFALRGFVVALKPPVGNISAQARIVGLVDGTFHNVWLSLTMAEYIVALEAYQERLTIRCDGELAREGNDFVLRNPRNLDLERSHT